MAANRSSLATGFLTILGLGAIAVAMIAAAIALSNSAAERRDIADRDSAALELLFHRQAVASAVGAEQAAVAFDLLDGVDDASSLEKTLARQGVVADARAAAGELAERDDSVGAEAARWLTSLDQMLEPSRAPDPIRQLMTLEEALDVACCAGHQPSDAHHADGLRDLEGAANISGSIWDIFYIGVRGVGPVPVEGRDPVLQFIGSRGVAGRLPPLAPSATDTLRDELSPVVVVGVPESAIDAVLANDSAAVLDDIVEHASLRSLLAVPAADAYAAAGEVAAAVDELYDEAVASAVATLEADGAAAAKTHSILIVVVPLLFALMVAVGVVVYRLARERERSLLRERQALESRDRFMRMISHELRTPAAAISGFAEMLTGDRSTLTEDEIDEFLTIIHRQSRHLGVIVDDLLTLTQLEAGKLAVEHESVNVWDAVRQAALMVESRHPVDIELDVAQHLEVEADQTRVVQILRNLLENAAKYGRTGVAVHASADSTGCEIIVSDAGPGVPAAKVETIFTVWERVDDDEGTPRGYGIGLPVARLLAGAMAGSLVYRPNSPTGSQFVLQLPASQGSTETGGEPLTSAGLAEVRDSH